VSPQRFYIFIIFFSLIAILAADFVTAENATHARFYGSPPLYFLAFSPFRLFFLALFFGNKGKPVHCTCHKQHNNRAYQRGSVNPEPKEKIATAATTTVAAAAIYFIIIAHEHNGKKIT